MKFLKLFYGITRLYIPETLFKYYLLTYNIALNEQKLNALEQKRYLCLMQNI